MAAGLMNPEIGEKGAAITKALMEGAAAGWSTLVGKNITYVLGPTDYGRPAEIVKSDDVGEVVMTPVEWSGDHSGSVYLLVATAGAKELVAYMMALMLGGDPQPRHHPARRGRHGRLRRVGEQLCRPGGAAGAGRTGRHHQDFGRAVQGGGLH